MNSSLLLGPHNNSWLDQTRQSAPVPVQCYPGPGFVASLTARSLDRGNNFKVHSHQANPTHDINLRFFTFCKMASSLNVSDNGSNIKTIYSVMC